MIKLGQKVKDILTGVNGIVVCRSEWVSGCVRITIQQFGLKEGKPIDVFTTDECNCEVLDATVIRFPQVSPPAGPTSSPKRHSNPTR